MLLTDTLYVPGLGVNLLSARRICQSGLKGSFNEDHMFFKLYKERVIKVTIRNRLYIVTYMADSYYNKAFAVFPANNKDAEEVVSVVKDRITDLTPKQESLYKLIHR